MKEIFLILSQKIGSFTFEFIDLAGNTGEVTATVDWITTDLIYKEEFESSQYTIEGNTIFNIRPGVVIVGQNEIQGTTMKEFKQNVTTNQRLNFFHSDATEVNEEEILGTGAKLKVGDEKEYTLIVRGDIDGNGKITINDLAKLKLHYIKLETLEGDALKGADVDGNGEVSMLDLAQMKLILIGKMEIK